LQYVRRADQRFLQSPPDPFLSSPLTRACVRTLECLQNLTLSSRVSPGIPRSQASFPERLVAPNVNVTHEQTPDTIPCPVP
jgi:hypothetical protein